MYSVLMVIYFFRLLLFFYHQTFIASWIYMLMRFQTVLLLIWYQLGYLTDSWLDVALLPLLLCSTIKLTCHVVSTWRTLRLLLLGWSKCDKQLWKDDGSFKMRRRFLKSPLGLNKEKGNGQIRQINAMWLD